MNYPEIQHSGDGGDRQPEKRGVQGPRPSRLSVNKSSRKIGKPPLPAPPYHPPRAPPPHANREPVIIYTISPKIIHVDSSDFMSVVQRLTGLCSSSTTPETAAGGPFSPAARLAVLDRVSPPDRGRERTRATAIEDSEVLEMVNLGRVPGILSPAPANLQAVMPEMFSSGVDPLSVFGIEDDLISPWSFSGLFPGSTMFSPAPSPVIDFTTLFDF